MKNATSSKWIVLLEAARGPGEPMIDRASLGELASSWATAPPTTLYSRNRYAIQVPVPAADPASALSSAICLWKDALRRTSLPEWQLVRAELLTPGELEAELQAADRCVEEEGRRHASAAPSQDTVADELLRRALHDTLTGLPNREIFLDEIRRAQLGHVGESPVHAVMVVNVDAGVDQRLPDNVLLDIGRRLTRTARRGDTVARVGPAQFALLVPVPMEKDADRVALRIRDAIRRDIGHGEGLELIVSVGVAATSSGSDADDLILMAEKAMVAAKAAGGDCHRWLAARPGPSRSPEATTNSDRGSTSRSNRP